MSRINPAVFLALACYFLVVVLLSSCSQSRKLNTDFLYFDSGLENVAIQHREPIIQSDDLLSIQVYSRTLNQEQAAIFNIPASASGAAQGYQVNADGYIELPVIGLIKAAGLTKSQLQASLIQKLPDYVKNASVLVRFLQFNVNVLGEVHSPGTQKFTVDNVTIIDAISAAGDLTDFGKRDNIMVIRDENGKKVYHTVDLRSKSVFKSPVYTLQPNDIVYVRPNNIRLKKLNRDPDVQQRTGLYFTIFSFALNIIVLLVTNIK